MKKLNLRYVAAVYPVTGIKSENFETDAPTLRDLIHVLDKRYGGFNEMFIDPSGGKLTLNTMIYYGEAGGVPSAVLNLDLPVADGATITFW